MAEQTWIRLIPNRLFLVSSALLALSCTSLCAQDMIFRSTPSKARLLELFSSEGCSSCPPAEAWVSRLKDDPGIWSDLFPVVFHVDYWDNLGWPDRFARSDYTHRQQDYASRLGQDSVYTPEFVANGREWRGWFHGESLPAAPTPTSGDLTVSTKQDAGLFSAIYSPAQQNAASAYTLNVALLGFNVVTDVKRGENGGRQLQHDFVVLAFASKPMLPGKSFTGAINLASATGDTPGAAVAWVTAADGSIVQIAGGWLKK